MLNKNTCILFAAQSLGMSAMSLLVLITGIFAAEIGPNESLATLPIALIVISTAVSTLPAILFMQRFGRKKGFLLAFAIAVAGMLSGMLATVSRNFYLLCVCNSLIGCFVAFAYQFRFAAIESLPAEHGQEKNGQVVSFMLIGGVIAAFIGPEIADIGKDMLAWEFAGSFLLMTGLLVAALIIMLFFEAPALLPVEDTHESERPLVTILKQPVFVVAVSSSLVSYAVMSFLMTATPISMNHIDGFNFAHTKQVIQWHIAAMFLPSIFNIFLFRYIGLHRLMAAGAIIYLIMGAVALQGHQFMHYGASLILLGVGWNFLYVAGTALLPKAYSHQERFKTQAANDFIVYTVQALAALSAGWFLFNIGWDSMVKLTLPISGIMLILVAAHYFSQLRTNSASIKITD